MIRNIYLTTIRRLPSCEHIVYDIYSQSDDIRFYNTKTYKPMVLKNKTNRQNLKGISPYEQLINSELPPRV